MSTSVERLLLKQDVEDFLYHEADLLDERQYEAWLELFTEDVRYWMPMRRNVPADELAREFTREGMDVNWFDEGKDTLTRRVKQILTGVHWAEQPPSRICHMVSNVQILDARPDGPSPDEVTVKSRFLLYRNRVETETDMLLGKREDVLRRVNGGWQIARRKIILDQSVLLAKNLTFFFLKGTMHFGIFVEEMRQGLSQAAAFREAFATAERAEALGVDCVWLGEIHFTPTRSVISASLQVASSIATRTRRLRVGTAVTVLPLNHPLRIAEEVATLDHISEGRLEFGIGRSGVVRSYDTYGIPYGESQARFREALEIITRAWKGEPFSYEGEFYRVSNATVTPRPYQQPHPPMRMAATTRETFPAVAKMGLPVFIGLRATEISDLQEDLALYRDAWREAGHAGDPSVYLRIPVYVSDTERGAIDEPRESLTAFFARQTELARSAVGRAGTPEARRAQAERMATLTYDGILARKVVTGTAPRVIDRLRELRDALGLDGFVVELNPGGLIPAELETRSLERLGREVIPAFR